MQLHIDGNGNHCTWALSTVKYVGILVTNWIGIKNVRLQRTRNIFHTLKHRRIGAVSEMIYGDGMITTTAAMKTRKKRQQRNFNVYKLLSNNRIHVLNACQQHAVSAEHEHEHTCRLIIAHSKNDVKNMVFVRGCCWRRLKSCFSTHGPPEIRNTCASVPNHSTAIVSASAMNILWIP